MSINAFSNNASSEPGSEPPSAVDWERRAFLVAVILAPLPLGANRPWAWTTLALAVGLLLLVRTVRGGLGRWPPWLWVATGLYMVAPVWALIQALPLVLQGWAHPVWDAVPGPGAIAAAPEAAVTGALRLMAYGGGFLLAWHHARDGTGARTLLRALVLAVAGYAAYGLLMLLSGLDLLLWWEKWAYRGVFTATFVNRNAAAAFMGLGVLLSVTAGLRAVRRADRKHLGGAVAAGGLCLLGLLLSQSRGGAVATVSGLIGLSVSVHWALRPPWRRLRRVLAAGALAGVLILALAGGGLFERLGTRGVSDADRALVQAAMRQAIADRPWLGQGLGGFDLTFPAWRPEALAGHWDKAHATWLELVYDLGVPAAGAMHLALLVVGLACGAGLRLRHRRQEYPALGLGALILAGVHGLVDFPFQMPANALWLAVILGMAAAQSLPTRFGNRPLRAAASDRAAGSSESTRR